MLANLKKSSLVLIGSFSTMMLGSSVSSQTTGIEPPHSENQLQTQCIHQDRGLEDCSVDITLAPKQYTVHWSDSTQTTFRFAGKNLELLKSLSDNSISRIQDWQEADQAGLCWNQTCFKTALQPLLDLDKTLITLDAICIDGANSQEDCTIEHIPDYRGGHIRWLNGRQASFKSNAQGLFYAQEKYPEQWTGPVKAGICANEFCVLGLAPNPQNPESSNSER